MVVIGIQIGLNGGQGVIWTQIGSSGLMIWLIGGRGLIRTQILLIRGRWGHQDSDLAHGGSSGLRFGSMGVTGGHLDSDLAHLGLSEPMGTQIWLVRTQIWFIGGHLLSSGLRSGSQGLIGTQIWPILFFECINITTYVGK